MDERNIEEKATEKKKIKNKELWRAIKFTLFSISAGVIQFVSSMLLKAVILDKFIPEDAAIYYITELNKSTFIADTVGLILSILWNFTFNRKFTFKAANNVPIAMLLAFVFYIPFYHFQIWYVDVVEKSLANIGMWGFVVALGTCMLINFVLEFLWQKFVVFRNAVDTNDLAKKEQDGNADNVSAEQITSEVIDSSVQSVSAEKYDNKEELLSQKIEVDIVLNNAGSNKLAVIKVIRNAMNLDLEQAKKLVESAPATVAKSRLKDEAQKIADELQKVGAEVELM